MAATELFPYADFGPEYGQEAGGGVDAAPTSLQQADSAATTEGDGWAGSERGQLGVKPGFLDQEDEEAGAVESIAAQAAEAEPAVKSAAPVSEKSEAIAGAGAPDAAALPSEPEAPGAEDVAESAAGARQEAPEAATSDTALEQGEDHLGERAALGHAAIEAPEAGTDLDTADESGADNEAGAAEGAVSEVDTEREDDGQSLENPGPEAGDPETARTAATASDTEPEGPRLLDPEQEKVFTGMIERQEANIYRLARGRGLSHDDAQDVAQTTFLNAARYFHSFEQGTNERAWLSRIATNLMNTGHRREHSESHLPMSSSPTAYEAATNTVQATGPGVEAQVIADIRRQEVFQDIAAKVPTHMAQVLILTTYYGYTYKECGEILGLNPLTVASARFRAIAKMREEYSLPPKSAAPANGTEA